MRKILIVMLLLSANLAGAETFIYVNEDSLYDLDPERANTVSAFMVDSTDGSLVPVAGTPFFADIGHYGCWGGGFPSINRITTAGDFLYLANCFSFSISGFEIDPTTGVLTLLADSPTLLQPLPVLPVALGISLAATPDGQYLVAAVDTEALAFGRIHVFSVGGTGALSEVAGSPFPIECPSTTGIKITPNGNFLVVSCPAVGMIRVFGIGAGGALTEVASSPFEDATGVPVGLDINCASDLLFGGFATFDAPGAIGVYDLGADGSLTEVAGSPFQPAGMGVNSQVVLLSPDDDRLFVSNHGIPGDIDSETVSVFTVGAGGTLGPVANSPFPTGNYFQPGGLATDPAGAYLYATTWDPASQTFGFGFTYGFAIDGSGELAPVPGEGALGNTDDGLPQWLTAYPAKSCASDEAIEPAIDIKFCSDPNGFNCRARGTLPVTIFGSAELDVADIEISSLRLCLASDTDVCTGAPLSSTAFDRGDPDEDLGAAMCAVAEGVQQRYLTQDDYTDLDVAFDNREVAQLIGCSSLAKGDISASLILTGETTDGTSIGSLPVNDPGVDQLLIQSK